MRIMPEDYSLLEKQILETIKDTPKTRDELSKELEHPRTTIFDGLKPLIICGEIKAYFIKSNGKRTTFGLQKTGPKPRYFAPSSYVEQLLKNNRYVEVVRYNWEA